MDKDMMNTLSKTVAVAIIAISTPAMSGYSTHAFAAAKSISKAQGEGFRACRAQGKSGYTAVIKGKTNSGTPQRGGTWPFTIRDCFPSKSQCDQYINRIKNTVRGIDEITRKKCSSRA